MNTNLSARQPAEPSRPTARRGLLLWGAVAGLLLVAALVQAVPNNADGDPRVKEGSFEILSSQMSGTLLRISGLRDNVISATYTGASATELLNCNAELFHTVTGANPGTTKTKDMPAVGTCNTPSQTKSYSVALTATDLAGAGTNGVVTFRIRILDGTGAEIKNDNNNGQFYKYRLDRSQGTLVNVVPVGVASASVTDAVTADARVGISFRIQDNALEAALDLPSIAMTVDGTTYPNSFVCTDVSAWVRDCAFDYATQAPTFSWTEGTHTVVVNGRDLTANTFTGNTFRFIVDKTAPAVTAVTAVPNKPVTLTPGGRPLTAPGTPVTVTATVTDPQIDTKGTNNVFAQLFNTTHNLQSGLVPMKFNTANSKWEVKDLVVPATWNQQRANISARVVAADLALNIGTNASVTPGFEIDPRPPFINETVPPAVIRDVSYKVRATITDNLTGVDNGNVRITFTNVSGSFKTAPTGVTKVGTLFTAPMTPAGNVFTYDLPAANHGAVLVYFITAPDRAGGNATSPVRTLTVDAQGPVITELSPLAYRGAGSHTFRVSVVDLLAGVNASTVRVHYGTGSGFENAVMTADGTTGTYVGNFTLASPADGALVRYFFEARDTVGNLGTRNTSAAPLQYRVDLAAPVFNLTAPGTSSGAEFDLNWSATDAGSGVDTYTIQARALVAGGPPGNWVTIANATRSTGLSVCADGGRTYEFRGYATDKAGNAGTLSEAALATTVLSGDGCTEGVDVRVVSPTVAQSIDAKTSSPLTVQYVARSTKTLTPTLALRIKVEFSPDQGTHWYVLSADGANTGRYDVALGPQPSCKACQVRITATTLSGVTSHATSVAFGIRNGSPTVDLDSNGLADSWELLYGDRLGEFAPEADPDGDGLTNQEEAGLGTDPRAKDTDGDGVNDRLESRAGTSPLDAASTPSKAAVRSEQFTHWYWAIPALFAGTALLFFVGLAGRW